MHRAENKIGKEILWR